MHLQRVSARRGAPTRRTTQDGARWGCGRRRGPPLWAWLLLGALLVPGACSFLSEDQEELLVELHNHYRGQVSPSAAAMMPLKWDSSLKLIAEGYAAKCVWNHNPELEETGENLFAGTGPLDLREALEKWFLEHLDYDYHNNSCDEDKMCGHYTQMVWAGTHRVGCAFHLCNNMEGLNWDRVSFLVCNYYPAGNYEDERPYVEGDWCSRCPENLQKCENNLCVADTEEDVEEDEGDEEKEGWTVIPPAVTSDLPFLPAEEDEEEEQHVVPPPATTEAPVQPPTATTPPSAATTSSRGSEDPPSQSTPPPGAPSTTLREEEEEEAGEEMKEEERQEEKRGDVIYIKNKPPLSGGAAASACVLLVCLTAALTARP